MTELKKLDAYAFAKQAHEGQKRVLGEDYITHPLDVAEIAKKHGADEATIYACLLHDVVEDTPITLEEITEIFGQEVAFLVEGVTKVENPEFTKQENQEKTLEKVSKYAKQDKRVLLIKLSDRIHNMMYCEHAELKKTLKRYKKENPLYIHLGRKYKFDNLTNKLSELNSEK